MERLTSQLRVTPYPPSDDEALIGSDSPEADMRMLTMGDRVALATSAGLSVCDVASGVRSWTASPAMSWDSIALSPDAKSILGHDPRGALVRLDERDGTEHGRWSPGAMLVNHVVPLEEPESVLLEGHTRATGDVLVRYDLARSCVAWSCPLAYPALDVTARGGHAILVLMEGVACVSLETGAMRPPFGHSARPFAVERTSVGVFALSRRKQVVTVHRVDFESTPIVGVLHEADVRCAALSPDAAFVALSDGTQVQVFSASTGQRCVRMAGEGARIRALRFSSNDSLLVAVDPDQVRRYAITPDDTVYPEPTKQQSDDAVAKLVAHVAEWCRRKPEGWEDSAFLPGALDREIAAQERASGAALPDALRALYAWHNGSRPGGSLAAEFVLGYAEMLPLCELDEGLWLEDPGRRGRRFLEIGYPEARGWMPFFGVGDPDGTFGVDLLGTLSGIPGAIVALDGHRRDALTQYRIEAPDLVRRLGAFTAWLNDPKSDRLSHISRAMPGYPRWAGRTIPPT